jgi:Flp pilus assembly protein TadG
MSRFISAIEIWARLWRRRGGSVAVEFAMLLPILASFGIGLIEGSLILFDYHRLAEAARLGARAAVLNSAVPSLAALSTASATCAGTSGGGVSCTGAAVSSAASFASILADMQDVMPALTAQNVRVLYKDSGISVNATTPGIITPSITVEIVNYEHTFFFLNSIPGVPDTLTFPAFSTTRIGASVTAS